MSMLLVSRADRVGVITLNRPNARNALSNALIDELLEALKIFDIDPEVGAIVLTGGDSMFCAGADIKELKELTMVRAYMDRFLQKLNDGVATIRKPVLGAVNGYALGGGCELAMMCDILYAADNAVFGQVEVKIGTIPGAGGTQRLIRAIGKAKAMHLILTGDTFTAQEAEMAGLVAKVFPADRLLKDVIEIGQRISGFSSPVIAMAKEAVNEAQELGLTEGQRFERRLYHATFGLKDSKEGMNAFVEKRKPQWANE
ncbi:ClpP/crotonase [Rickenella mellea]|uniref:ClpP/crotonase n=1 Tax=Rickenella mellea TaxID=50990 RepID=A0A4Y7Q4L1_9AGAM|nr:ClpP/crotonase [Rickenella mellea]